MKDIYESEMKFGSFSEMDLFEIEKSQQLKKLGKGIKSVEFILLNKKRNIIFLEAKKTCPNENNMHQTKEKEEKFGEYYDSIAEKFAGSLQVYMASIVNRYDDQEEVGENLRKIEDYHDKRIQLVLVIKEAETEWLAGPKARLEEKLLTLRKIWKAEIVVLNYELAKKYNLVGNV